MKADSGTTFLQQCLDHLTRHELSPMDFLPPGSVAEKLIGLVLSGPPSGVSAGLAGLYEETLTRLKQVDTSALRVVTLGGGTGLSNIIGGDSRRPDWAEKPFSGLKEFFPGSSSIVCVTDDGGSTGELLKDLPLIALGDLRHVLLSSIRRDRLHEQYGLDDTGARHTAARLHAIFNYRFTEPPSSAAALIRDAGMGQGPDLNARLAEYLHGFAGRLFDDPRLRQTLQRPQCLGNLLLAAAIFSRIDSGLSCAELAADPPLLYQATMQGLADIAGRIGSAADAVLPCTTVPAHLQFLYSNGVLVTGEYKSSIARRGYPVDRTMVEFLHEPFLPEEVRNALTRADIIILAPGSLYSSIIPILQVPGLADCIRGSSAFKILVSNIWVQKGETDVSRDAPERKFHVSDLIRAYNRNIPGGVDNLFSHILTLKLSDIPGSVLQNYALEDKEPIYLDRQNMRDTGFEPVEAAIYSNDQLQRRYVIQHDADSLALTVRTLWCLQKLELPAQPVSGISLPVKSMLFTVPREENILPCVRYQAISRWLARISFHRARNGSGEEEELSSAVGGKLRAMLADILWRHPDILLDHLRYTGGVLLVKEAHWRRCQQWDNIFSFYEPQERRIVIREDQGANRHRLEMAFLIALGQSLLGNYALEKTMCDIEHNGEKIGRVFQLVLREPDLCHCFLRQSDLDLYLELARLRRSDRDPRCYTRLINSDEGFTPPGLLFGLYYTWYLDNRFASPVEYKMSIMRKMVPDLIPEQVKIVGRRQRLISFFRETVFQRRLSPQPQ